MKPACCCEKPEPRDDEGGEPGEAERECPIGAEGRDHAAKERSRGQKLDVGNLRLIGRERPRVLERAFLAKREPGADPDQADDTERAEGIVPGMIDDDPVQRRHGQDDAEGRALRQDRGRQRALLVREPFVDGVHRHRGGRTFAGTEHDAADQQRGEGDGADHRKLRQRPDHRHGQQHIARCHLVDDEADHDGRDREQEEERGAEQAELRGLELQIGHDRHAGEADDDLVGEVHHHEEKEEKSDGPGALRRRLCGPLVDPLGHPCRPARHLGRSLSAHHSPRMSFVGTFDLAVLGANNGLIGNATPAFPHQVCYAALS